jgi:hypothetical protein
MTTTKELVQYGLTLPTNPKDHKKLLKKRDNFGREIVGKDFKK